MEEITRELIEEILQDALSVAIESERKCIIYRRIIVVLSVIIVGGLLWIGH